MALNKAKVLTVTSVKGGTGVSTTVLNMAGMFEKLNKKVLILDLDFYNSSIGPLLNLEYDRDIYNLFEDISNNSYNSFEDYVVNYSEYISVLPAPKDPRNAKKINSKILNTILYKAILKYDVILIDTNYMLNDITLIGLDNSDLILYVINNDFLNLKNMKTFVSILNDMSILNYKILLNNSACKDRDFYTEYEIKNILGVNIDYLISSSFNIKNINKYILEGKILTLDDSIVKKHKSTIETYESISNDLLMESKVI